MGENEGIVHRVSEGGIAGGHPQLKPLPIFIGPSGADEFNTVRSFLVPSACYRREDNSFDFDSSFIFDFDAGPLKELLDLHPDSKLSIFGHADPVGRDDFNKVLSGRRAQSILGLLLRDVSLWEDLYRHHDTQGKDKWGVKSVQIMLNRIGFVIGRADGVLDDPTREQLKKFETARGLVLNGFDSKQEIAEPTFKQLASEYMDVICTDDDNKPFKLTHEDFLARGKGNDGKGDVQGCGEFNPILLFSKAEKARLDQKDNQQERNEKNRPNRRVMILLFQARSKIDPAKWPCPTVKEGVAGCIKRFFQDGENRRRNQEEEREFEKTKDTFACRFYDRLVNKSPCEVVVIPAQFATWDVAPVNSVPASEGGLPTGAEVPAVPPQVPADDPKAPSLRQGA
jgi:Putative peptidoglycan binding domain